MKVFHHDDNDGRCAAFLFHKYLIHAAISPWVENNAEEIDWDTVRVSKSDFIEMDYNKRLPLELIKEGEAVYFLDFHPQKTEDYLWLREYSDLTIIDHHKTTAGHLQEMIDDYNQVKPKETHDIIDMDGCGAVLVAKHFLNFTDETMPEFIKLVDDWDRWVHAKPESKWFNQGSYGYDTSPFGGFWDTLWLEMDEEDPPFFVRSVIETGVMVGGYRERRSASLCRSVGFPVEFHGFRCFALNQAKCNSTWFDSVPGYDIYLKFFFNGTNWTVGLYSTTVDVSLIAKSHGGGGHVGAAGFVCNELPFIGGVANV